MKKLTALLLTLCMLLTAGFALAEEATLPEIKWSDVESTITEAGWKGNFVTLDEVAVKVWVPSVMSAVELTDEDRETGYIAYYATADQSAAMSVMYVDLDGMDLDAYAEELTKLEDVAEIQQGILNGLNALTYTLPDTNTACITFTTEAGYVLEFAFAPMNDEGFAAVATVVMASIQAAE